jgi:hypothetical protein
VVAHSNGAVRLVILIKVDVQHKTITIEKYDRTRGMATRSNAQGPWTPRKLTTVILNQQVDPVGTPVNGMNARVFVPFLRLLKKKLAMDTAFTTIIRPVERLIEDNKDDMIGVREITKQMQDTLDKMFISH